MKNITVTVDEDTYRKARIEAARRDTSVSQLVRQFLRELAQGESEWDRLTKMEMQVRETIRGFSAGDRMSRQDVHQR